MDSFRQFIKSASPLGSLVTGLAFVYANALFNHGLIPSMEPRFAQVISEMMAAGEYLIPIKNGIPYVEYPPLLYWLAILFAKLGLSIEAAIRLPGYISFIVWILYTSKLQSLLFKEWPDYIMPILGAALPAVLWHFFIAQTDSLLIAGVLISFVGFTKLRLGLIGRYFPWELWLGVSLAAAAKGPVGIACTLPAMMLEVLLAVISTQRAGMRITGFVADLAVQLKSLAWVRGLMLLTITLVLWYLVTGYIHGWEYVRAVFVYQNFDRYLGGMDGHIQPWWYYFKSVFAGLFPLSIFVPAGLWFAVKKLNKLPQRLVFSWAVFTFLFFSISASKQGKYILPAAPAFLVLGIIGIKALFKTSLELSIKRFKTWAVGLIVIWSVAVVIFLPFYSDKIAHIEGFSAIREVVTKQPGRIVHFGWPKSLTLYELGSPMDYVRSSRELYQKVVAGEIRTGDYLLVAESDFPQSNDIDQADKLKPLPKPPFFERVLSVKAEKRLQLFRVLPSANLQNVPATPNPAKISWRDAKFDTD